MKLWRKGTRMLLIVLVWNANTVVWNVLDLVVDFKYNDNVPYLTPYINSPLYHICVATAAAVCVALSVKLLSDKLNRPFNKPPAPTIGIETSLDELKNQCYVPGRKRIVKFNNEGAIIPKRKYGRPPQN